RIPGTGCGRGCRGMYCSRSANSLQICRPDIMCTGAYTGDLMEPIRVGIRDFRENLATYLLESDQPVAITRHGDTIGYYIPARRKRSEAERTALREAASRLQKMLKAEGISEEEIVADFKRWRAGKRK